MGEAGIVDQGPLDGDLDDEKEEKAVSGRDFGRF
jgi:hypothetical protein